VWFDITLWMKCVEQIRDCFIRHDPAHAQEYRHNADVYLQELNDLDTYIRLRVAQLPEKRRVLITAHDAFSYFGRAYGFTIVSLQGISTDSEIGVGDVTRVVDYIIAHDIPALFAEASLPKSNVAAVQQAVRAHGKEVGIGPELYSDTLGEPGTVQETYVGMVRSVVDRIVDALQGKAHHE
jgi:manganese/zinc/iron transport system substrate-binding protein